MPVAPGCKFGPWPRGGAFRLWRREGLIAFLLTFGFLLRFRHLLLERSLWLDEAFLSLAVLERSLSNIIQLPLPYNQTPPPLFLIVVKILTIFCGTSEVTLRMFPFIGACAALLMFPYVTSKRSHCSAILAIFLFSISYGGVYYAAELKQYSIESFISVLFLLVARALLEGRSREHSMAWCFFFVIAPWMGFSTLFLLAGLGGWMLYASLATTKNFDAGFGWGLLAMGIVSFGVMYLVYARPASLMQLSVDYWKDFAAPWLDSSRSVLWYGSRAAHVMGHYFLIENMHLVAFLVGLAMLGAFAVLRSDTAYGLVLTLPFVAAVVLSLAGRFPLHERLMLFALPMCCLLVAEGAILSGRLLARIVPAASWLPSLAVVLLLARPVVSEMFRDSVFTRQEFKAISERILGQLRDDEPVFVFQAAVPIFQYYSHRDPRIARFHPVTIARGDAGSLRRAVRVVKTAGRGWVIFAHNLRPEERQFEAAFDRAGEIRERLSGKGVWAFAFTVVEGKALEMSVGSVRADDNHGKRGGE